MKKNIFTALLAGVLALTLILSMSACSKRKAKNETPSNTLETPTYLEGETPSDNTSDQTPTESHTPTPTEKPSTAPTEQPTEQPTETPAEPSLEYKSFGNGTCTVVGIGDIDDLYVVIPEKSPSGDVVTTIEAGAFKGNPDITVVQISSTVYSIGDMAFADCKSLVHIAVDEKNTHYSDVDGVLFDIDKTTLICYPSAKAATSLLLPDSITTIGNMALYGCDNLKMIKFEGSVEVWASIAIGEKNYGLYTASLVFGE